MCGSYEKLMNEQTFTRLESAGVRFRNQIESGPGGKQIQIEDPDGSPIELHQYT